MNALQVNPTTGFLESISISNSTFDSKRKEDLLATAEKCFQATGTMPDITTLCAAIGIEPRTFQRHLEFDEKFKEAWDNLLLKAKWQLESKMYEYAKGKSGYMHMITWLRRNFAAEYNPEARIVHVSDNSQIKDVSMRLNNYIDADIVEKE